MQLYRHPKSELEDFNRYISKCLIKINKEKKECYVTGDFNVDLLKYDTNHKYAEFLNNMTSFGFLPQILQPTRIGDYSASVIDNIYSNNLDQDSEREMFWLNLLIISHNYFLLTRLLLNLSISISIKETIVILIVSLLLMTLIFKIGVVIIVMLMLDLMISYGELRVVSIDMLLLKN